MRYPASEKLEIIRLVEQMLDNAILKDIASKKW